MQMARVLIGFDLGQPRKHLFSDFINLWSSKTAFHCLDFNRIHLRSQLCLHLQVKEGT